MTKLIFMIIALISMAAIAAESWRESETKLNSLQGKVNAKKEEVEKLIEEERATTDKEHLHLVMDQLAKTHHELLEKDAEFRELRDHVRFSFPDHGSELERRYRPLRKEDLDHYEDELGVDGKLNHVKIRVHQIYGKDSPAPPPQSEELKPDPGSEASSVNGNAQKPSQPRINRSIIKPEPTPDRIKLSE